MWPRRRGLCAFPCFLIGLAGDTQSGDGTGFQAFEADFVATFFAAAVGAGIKTLNGFVDFGEKLALAIAHPQDKRTVGFKAGAVGWVGEAVRRLGIHMAHGTVGFGKDLAFAAFQ